MGMGFATVPTTPTKPKVPVGLQSATYPARGGAGQILTPLASSNAPSWLSPSSAVALSNPPPSILPPSGNSFTPKATGTPITNSQVPTSLGGTPAVTTPMSGFAPNLNIPITAPATVTSPIASDANPTDPVSIINKAKADYTAAAKDNNLEAMNAAHLVAQGAYKSLGYASTDENGAPVGNPIAVGTDPNSIVDQAQAGYTQAEARGDTTAMAAFHAMAEQARATGGYSGGEDGSQYIKQQQQGAEQVGQVFDKYQALKNEAAQSGNENLAAFGAMSSQMMDYIDKLEARITEQFTSQMTTDDPALKAAIQVIRDEVSQMEKDTLQEMNARGMVHSGVYAEALSRLHSDQLSQEQQVTAARFGDLQNQLNSAIMSLATARIGALGQNQSYVANQLSQNQQQQTQIGTAGLNAQQQDNQFSATLGWDKEKTNAALAWDKQSTAEALGWDKEKLDLTLTEQGRQFDNQLAFDEKKLTSDEQSFYAKLSQDNKQFYAGLASSEKMAFASMANSRGMAAAGNSLEERKFQYMQDQTLLAQNANKDGMTAAQMDAINVPGGTMDTMIKDIQSGKRSVSDLGTQIWGNTGYTDDTKRYMNTRITNVDTGSNYGGYSNPTGSFLNPGLVSTFTPTQANKDTYAEYMKKNPLPWGK